MTNTPRFSPTSSWTILGVWKSIKLVRTAIDSFLLGVKLDDERFLHRRVDLLALGPLEDLAGEVVVVGLEPGRDGGSEIGRVPDDLLGLRARSDRDHVVGLALVARD